MDGWVAKIQGNAEGEKPREWRRQIHSEAAIGQRIAFALNRSRFHDWTILWKAPKPTHKHRP